MNEDIERRALAAAAALEKATQTHDLLQAIEQAEDAAEPLRVQAGELRGKVSALCVHLREEHRKLRQGPHEGEGR